MTGDRALRERQPRRRARASCCSATTRPTSCRRRWPAATSACRRPRWRRHIAYDIGARGVTLELARPARRAGDAHPLLAARHRPEPRRGRPDAGHAALRRHDRPGEPPRRPRPRSSGGSTPVTGPTTRAIDAAIDAHASPRAARRRWSPIHSFTPQLRGPAAAAVAGRRALAPRRPHRAAADRRGCAPSRTCASATTSPTPASSRATP